MIKRVERLMEILDLPEKASYEEFCGRLSILDISDRSGTFAVRSDIRTFLNRVAKRDDRRERLELYQKNLYRILVQDREEAISHWFRKYVELTEPVRDYFHLPMVDLFREDENVFEGFRHSRYGRICKNINFDSFYNTRKLYLKDSEYVLGLMKAMFQKFHIRNSLVSPAFFDHICQLSGYDRFWLDFMIGANRPSIFSPVAYMSILNKLFRGDTLLAPVMGWNSYQLAFYSSPPWKNFISTDVIPSVVSNGRELHSIWEKSQDGLFSPEKKVDLYCCPSQDLDRLHGFSGKYGDSVDAVLFSPPYFDLEIYESEDQSITTHPTYSDWLSGYWEQTVMTCRSVMRKKARFGFVISNYVNKDKIMTNISEDMVKIAEKHLNIIGRYRVKWSSISGSRQARKTRDGNYEDLWLLEKS